MPLHLHMAYALIDCQPLHEDARSVHLLIIMSVLLYLDTFSEAEFPRHHCCLR